LNSNTKKILILLILGMGFVFLHNIKLEFGHRQKSNVIIPKESGVYSENFIHIDGSIANNWSYTVANYTWMLRLIVVVLGMEFL